VSKKHWMAMMIGTGMMSASACTGELPGGAEPAQATEQSAAPSARLAQSGGVGFVARAEGFRAEAAGQQIEISEGVIALAAAPVAGGGATAQRAAVTLETTGVRRGAYALDVTALGSALVAPELVETARGELVERLRSNREGAEQSWWFDRAPGAQGDLVVEITPAGARYAETTAAGLRFERAGELSLRYSHGIWVEADGDRWPVPATFVDGRIRLTVPASVIAGSSFPAVLDPQIIVSPIGGQPG
jgi:hypothetical protein